MRTQYEHRAATGVPSASAILLLLSVLAVSGGGAGLGCAARRLDTRLLESASSRSADGDWNDIDASVGVAAGEAEMAVVAKDGARETERIFELRTIRDQPAWLVITRSNGGTGDESVMLSMRCTVGRFGDERQEKRLLKALERRLGELRGVGTYPLD